MSENEPTLPPVLCPEPDCGVAMMLLPGNKVVCPVTPPHGPEWPLPEKERRAKWRAEQRKVAADIELTRLPQAVRTPWREATSGSPGGYFYRIDGHEGLWQTGRGEGDTEASYLGNKRMFRPLSKKVEAELLELLTVLVPAPKEKAPADAEA